MSMKLNKVTAIVTVGGKQVLFSHLTLEQEFNRHHIFSILLDHEALEKRWLGEPRQVFSLVGGDVTIILVHNTGEENLFIGKIKKVSYVGKNGVHNGILISGGSPTLMLDGNKTMDSFTDKSLSDVVEESVKNSGSGAEVVIKPAFTGSIDYLCQYEESCFEFLNRLSRIYGEWFYYDGREIHFGKPDQQETIELTYDVNLKEIDLSVQVMPVKFGRYDYLVHDSKEVSHTSTDDDVEVAGYAKIALSRSTELYGSEGAVPVQVPVLSRNEVETLVIADKSRAVSEMLVLSGASNTSRVGIGKIIKAKLPQAMEVAIKDIDRFLVGKVVHTIDESGRYSNRFTAYVADAGAVPIEAGAFPRTGPQIATVKENEDSKGRIKVQHQWQAGRGKTTNWIRVQTPDAGTSEKGARGSVFIPEIGDQVMIGFEYGDPNRPYVMGSLFPESIGTGGGAGNKSKSIVSRSGIAVLLDDESGSITIKDKNGTDNMVVLDGEGNVAITSKESITLNCGESTLMMNKSGEIGVNGVTLFVGGSTSVDFAAGSGVNGEGGDMSGVHIGGNEVSASSKGDVNIGAENDVNMVSAKNITVAAEEELITRGQSKISIN